MEPMEPHKTAEIKTIYLGDKKVLVSSDGFIKHKIKWRKPSIVDRGGGIRTTLPFNRQGLNHRRYCNYDMHWLLATAFCNNPFGDEYVLVNHKDGDKTNNSISNLEWITKSKEVFKYDKGGFYTYEKFNSVTQAALSVRGRRSDSSAISSCCTGKKYNWKGYEWSFYPPATYKVKRPELRKQASNYMLKRKCTRTDYVHKNEFIDEVKEEELGNELEEVKKEVEEEEVGNVNLIKDEDVFGFNNVCDDDLFDIFSECAFEF